MKEIKKAVARRRAPWILSGRELIVLVSSVVLNKETFKTHYSSSNPLTLVLAV